MKSEKWLLLLPIAALILANLACVDLSTRPAQNGSVTFKELGVDSEYAGTYFAKRTNMGQEWQESGTFTPMEAVLRPKVGTGYHGEVTLSARPDYHWVLQNSGYYRLEKKK